MQNSKSFMLFLAIGLLTIFSILYVVRMGNAPARLVNKNADLTYLLTPLKTDLKVGEQISIPVYLTGRDAYKTTAFDIKMYYDNTKFNLDRVTPGVFFDKYITVKWDEQNAWFALALSPSTPRVSADPTKPMLMLELTAIAKSQGAIVSSGTSTVYLTKMGGFTPKTNEVKFIIK